MKFFILMACYIAFNSSVILAKGADEQPGLAIIEDLGNQKSCL